jgi:hypothetical protein
LRDLEAAEVESEEEDVLMAEGDDELVRILDSIWWNS